MEKKIFFLKDKFIKLLKNLMKKQYTIQQIKEKFKIKESELKLLVDNNFLINIKKIYEDNLQSINIFNKNNYLKLETEAYITRTPIYAKFELTYNCNYNCKHCYVKNVKSKILSFDKIKHILNELKENGVIYLYLTGGEPLLHPGIIDILQYASKLGFITTLQTNGYNINKNFINYFKDLKHFSITISFHSLNEKKFDSFTNFKGSFKKTWDIIKQLRKNNINFFLKIPITSINIDEAILIGQTLSDKNIKFEMNTQILPDLSDNKSLEKFQSQDKEIIKKLFNKGFLNFQKNRCSALKSKLWINPEGDLYPCELYRIKIGNLINTKLQKLWENTIAKKVLNSNIYKIPYKCQLCIYEKYCNRCLAYNFYNKWENKLLYFCKKAKLIYEIKEQ